MDGRRRTAARRRARALATVALAAVLLTATTSVVTPAAAATAVVPSAAPAPRATTANRATTAYRAPVDGAPVVVRGFDDVGRYDAGHRGVDLAVAAPGSVRAAGAGTVTFAGQVAGRGVVTVLHPDGVRTSYEPVDPGVAAGQTVAAGDVLGVVRGAHGTFAPDTVLHWGARVGDRYVDPLSLLAPLGPVRLLPWDDP